MKFHYIRDLVNEKKIEIHLCRSKEQTADIFTKPLKADVFLKLKKMLGMMKFNELGLREAVGN